MKLKIQDMQEKTNKVVENDYLDLLDISAEFGEEEDNQLFQWVKPLQMMKMEILIHELLHMFEKQVLMLSGFYLKKFIVKV